ncbi:peptide/nickel transport system ATP-binding protein/glutathione transport system ATP-binding protein [Mameliella alba]|uniref:ABC transporter ATP-binding protein n=1 Tax=Mameliella alba TaxID=561184 RepID=UPI000884EDC0|nr:ABC transporter ATP-binding protein [Mameliella alba]OWV46513.1 ABC transporter ATP-binding protein [Mameliella alba]PTR37328.1 peptide/nickel transport system ATP-binding protein/glutathione transport system ATP-binding protein [Mameliella alba]GGF73900.1 ABC transporter permease [Mameliella alba]SDD75467.1 peptide/nickel transport system ATP-binding protein/glutathione transport system ATP-binding protein [Mameliella alba]
MLDAPVLSVKSLTVAFGSHTAVRDLSFDIHAGETLALVGESGSGKSATALSVMRLIEREGGRITAGQIRLGAQAPIDLAQLSDHGMQTHRGNRISMIFQEPMTSLNPVMRIGEQLGEVLRRHQGMGRKEARIAAERALDQVRIPDPARRLDQYPHELSGGLRQRVMIAIALACRPDVLIADEPTTALDVTTQAEVLKLLKSLQQEIGMAILFITHDMGVVAEIADRVVVMRHGNTEEVAYTGALFKAPQSQYARDLMAATPKLGLSPLRPQVPSAEPVLKVEGLSKSFARSGGFLKAKVKVPAVKDVSFEIRPGETLGLVGESGCGKSTLSRTLMRLIEPDAGRVILAGRELTGLGTQALQQARADVQMVFQDPFASLNPRMKVRDLITEPAYLHSGLKGAARAALASDLLEMVTLDASAADRYPHQFSGGQRQRLCLARALSVSPKVIVADEAVSALDVSTAARVTALMQELQEKLGIAFLFISHDIAVVERVSHRIAVMYRGEIVEAGETEQVLRSPHHPYTKRLLSAVPSPLPRKPGRQDLQLPSHKTLVLSGGAT